MAVGIKTFNFLTHYGDHHAFITTLFLGIPIPIIILIVLLT